MRAIGYDFFAQPVDRLGFGALRRRAEADLSGRVLEVGAGTASTSHTTASLRR